MTAAPWTILYLIVLIPLARRAWKAWAQTMSANKEKRPSDA